MERESWRMMKQMNSIKQVTLSLVVMLCFSGIESQGQQLRDAFRNVQQAVVIVRTEQKGMAPFPQEGLVSLNGLGSGVLISNDGKVLTAAHLVQSADRTMVEFAQGELIPATVIGSSLSADVALLQLEHCPAFVVGAPYGISSTLTAGHVSGRRSLKRSETTTGVEFLQTDASINMGNSGSPVFNLNGEVMGIVSNIMSRSGGSEGLAFAATSNTARRLLLEQKPFWTGIEGLLVDGTLAKALNLTQPAGVLVQRVAEGSIFWRWGIHGGTLRATVEGEEIILGGDIILRVNETSVENDGSYDEICRSIGSLKPGDKLRSYGAAKAEVLPSIEHLQQKYQNNRAENSHQPTRLREHAMRRFKSSGHAQRFLSVFGVISSHFRVGRHLYRASGYKEVMKSRFA